MCDLINFTPGSSEGELAFATLVFYFSPQERAPGKGTDDLVGAEGNEKRGRELGAQPSAP